MERSVAAVRSLHHITVAGARLGRLSRALFFLVLPLRLGRLHHDAAGPPSSQSKWALGGFRQRSVGRVSTVHRTRPWSVSFPSNTVTPQTRIWRSSARCHAPSTAAGHGVLPLVAIFFRVEIVFPRGWYMCVGSRAPGQNCSDYCRAA